MGTTRVQAAPFRPRPNHLHANPLPFAQCVRDDTRHAADSIQTPRASHRAPKDPTPPTCYHSQNLRPERRYFG
eukprot:scaffold34916_cov170-Amphora_coffeaeformis.AAC.7